MSGRNGGGATPRHHPPEALAGIRLEVETANAAFGGDPRPELVRILRWVADTIETHPPTGWPWKIRDINGNTCGRLSVRINRERGD